MNHLYFKDRTQTDKPSSLVGKRIPCVSGCCDLSTDIIPALEEFHALQGQVLINPTTKLCMKVMGWSVSVWGAYSQRAELVGMTFHSGNYFTLDRLDGLRKATLEEVSREHVSQMENILSKYECELKEINERALEFKKGFEQ